MSYKTGQLVWGASKAIGNVWIVTDGPARSIALVFVGKYKRYAPDLNTTQIDTIKPTSYLYELTPNEVLDLTQTYGPLPLWVLQVVTFPVPNLPRPKAALSATLPPGVIQKVQQALGVDLTSEPERAIVKPDETKCPISGGDHRYVGYTGLIHSFEYCVNCDAKRARQES